MLELAVALSALALGVAGAALAVGLMALRPRGEMAVEESVSPEEQERERRSDLRIREGIANLLHYTPGEEDER